MPTRKASFLERILVVMIIYGLILFALHIYDYLVRAYEVYWVQHPAVTCVDNARWAPTGPQQVTGQLEAFQMHAWSTLPARGLETLFLFSRDRHASGVMYFFEPVNGTDDVEVEVMTSYGSEGTPQERTVCTLRRSHGERRVGVLVATAATTRKLARYDATDMDDDSLKITVWLPGPPSGTDVIFVLQLETDLITQLRRERVISDPHRSTPSQGTPIEIDLDFMTGSLRSGGAFNRGKVGVSCSRLQPDSRRISPISGRGRDTPPPDARCSAQVAESMLCSDVRTHRAIPDQHPYLTYGDPFGLLSATVRLTMDMTIDTEDSAGV